MKMNNKSANGRMINRILLFTLIVLAATFNAKPAAAQDLHFSQFTESPLTLNPALCGSFQGTVLASINYRSQWSSVMGGGAGFNTMGATVEFQNLVKKWKKGYLSPGILFYNDKSGDAKMGTTEVALNMACGIMLNSKNTVAIGIQGAWAQRSMNTAGLQWGEQFVGDDYDPNAPTGEPTFGNSFSYMDFSAGANYQYSSGQVGMTTNNESKADVGFAVYHINQPDISFYGSSVNGTLLYMRYDIHGSLELGIRGSYLTVIPGFVYYSQGPSQELNTGIKLRYYVMQDESRYTGIKKGGNAFDMGIYYRWNDAVIIMLGMKVRDYCIGISYDENVSQLNVASSGRGAIELSLKYIK